MTRVEFHIPATVDMQFLSDVIDTATYLSIDYWADITDFARNPETPEKNWFVLNDKLDDSEEHTNRTVDVTVVSLGIERLLAQDNPLRLSQYIIKYIIDGVRNNDAGEIDSEAADAIVQAGLFNEIIYG